MLHFRWTCNGDGQISFDLSCTGSQCGIFLGTAKTCTTDVNCPTGSICMDIISPLDDPLSKTYTLGLPSSVQSSLALYGYQLPSFPPLSLSPMGWLDFIFPRCSSQKSAWKEDLQAVLSAVLRQTPPQTGTEKYCIANTRASAIMNDQNKWVGQQYEKLKPTLFGPIILPGVQSKATVKLTSTDQENSASGLMVSSVLMLVGAVLALVV